MGPDSSSVVIVLPRPDVYRDLTFVPWTDGQSNQQEYAKAVRRGSAFPDKLVDGNWDKTGKAKRGMLLQANLYGRATDVCDGLYDFNVVSQSRDAPFVSTIYKNVPLSVVAGIFLELQNPLSLHCVSTESFLDYELRFSEQMARQNALGSSFALSGALSALMILLMFE